MLSSYMSSSVDHLMDRPLVRRATCEAASLSVASEVGAPTMAPVAENFSASPAECWGFCGKALPRPIMKEMPKGFCPKSQCSWVRATSKQSPLPPRRCEARQDAAAPSDSSQVPSPKEERP